MLLNVLEFDGAAFDDLAWWVDHDRKKALRVISLIREVQRDPYHGPGQPERLKHDLAGCWSRRIDQEHRRLPLSLLKVTNDCGISRQF